MQGRIFVSYAAEDSGPAEHVRSSLEGAGLSCWIAPRDVRPGQDYAAEIMAALEDCCALVLVFSEYANGSPYVRKEVERAIARGKPVFPVRIRDVKPTGALEFFVSSAQWIDAFTPPLDRHLARLIAAIQVLDSVSLGVIPPRSRFSRRKAGVVLALGTVVVAAAIVWLGFPSKLETRSVRPPIAMPSPTTMPSPIAEPSPTPNRVVVQRPTVSPSPGSAKRPKSPKAALDAFYRAFDAKDFDAITAGLLGTRVKAEGQNFTDQIRAQLSLIRSQRPGTPDHRTLVLDTLMPAAPLGKQGELTAGHFTFLRYRSAYGAHTVCEDFWIEKEESGFGIAYFWFWPATSGRCSGPSEVDEAWNAGRQFLEHLDRDEIDVAYESLSSDNHEVDTDTVIKILRGIREIGKGRKEPRRRLIAFPIGTISPPGRAGEFVSMCFVSPLGMADLFEYVIAERQGDGTWVIARFSTGMGNLG